MLPPDAYRPKNVKLAAKIQDLAKKAADNIRSSNVPPGDYYKASRVAGQAIAKQVIPNLARYKNPDGTYNGVAALSAVSGLPEEEIRRMFNKVRAPSRGIGQ